MNKRLFGVDILRLVAVLGIFIFHSKIHMDINYGLLNNFINNGAIFMILFFMISGYVLCYTYQNSNYEAPIDIVRFYYKRVIAIYPAYLAICIIYFIVDKDLSFIKKIILLPMDLLLIQSSVDGTFSTWHHGGTWFVSCLLFCYLITPFLIPLIKKLTSKYCMVIIIALTCIDSYMQLVTHIMKYSTIYSNIMYRCIEFIIGMCLVKISGIVSNISNKKLHIISIIVTLSFIVGIDILSRIGGNYLDYGFFCNSNICIVNCILI